MNVVLLYISNFAYSNKRMLYSNNYHAIPGMSDIEVAEFVKYVDVIGPEAVRSSPVTSMTLTWHYHILESTSDRLLRLSRLAQVYIFPATTSADAERSF